MSEVDAEIAAVVTEAKKSFSLTDRVKGRNLRDDSVTIYLDEVTGAAIGGARDLKNGFGVTVDRERWGVLGEIDKAVADDPEADVSELRAEVVELMKTLRESALTYHLHAVPEVVVKAARRKAKQAVGPRAQNIEDYDDTLYAHLLAAMVRKVVDADGAESGGLDFDGAVIVQGYTPPDEYSKVIAKVNEIQFKQAISDQATGSADF